ncbi:MAG: hypothetical protein DSM106950_41810 [Stigonema ocellatum SAG 48.90 = DSM 106950]|nr:hypothetical protein [Stigonema ocellatum SAG 48.90 = DSM 106950]
MLDIIFNNFLKFTLTELPVVNGRGVLQYARTGGKQDRATKSIVKFYNTLEFIPRLVSVATFCPIFGSVPANKRGSLRLIKTRKSSRELPIRLRMNSEAHSLSQLKLTMLRYGLLRLIKTRKSSSRLEPTFAMRLGIHSEADKLDKKIF